VLRCVLPLCATHTQIDIEYLKNLVLQLYTTGEAEALLPVFTTLLSLGPEDVRRCRQVCLLCCVYVRVVCVPVTGLVLAPCHRGIVVTRLGVCVVALLMRRNQGLEQLSASTVPLPGAAAAVDSASSMFSGWSSWLGVAPTAAGAGAAGVGGADGGGGGSGGKSSEER
jgi:hypothetical protein